MKYISKEQLPHTRSGTYDVKISLTKTGLPRILPTYFRENIKSGNKRVIKTVLTILNLYRVLPYKGKVGLKTITKPWKGSIPTGLIEFIPKFIKMLRIGSGQPLGLPLFYWNPFPIMAKGSFSSKVASLITEFKVSFKDINGRKKKFRERIKYWDWKEGNSLSGFIPSLIYLHYNNSLWNSVHWFLNSSPQRPNPIIIGQKAFDILDNLNKVLRFFYRSKVFDKIGQGPGGRLALKDEPGKVRVFAMIDCISQWLLKPLHMWLFDILKYIQMTHGTDATFDQDKGVEFLQSLLKKNKQAFSFDLSSATDRLPILVQKFLLNSIVPNLGDNWANLLTNRSFSVPLRDDLRALGYVKGSTVRYATGQPMGALSSWAMLALTHHLIVQFAAFRARGRISWFKKYLILGDDIVILDKSVASEYEYLMEYMDVGVNRNKSLTSNFGFAEFAKRFVNSEYDFSGLSLKEFSSLHKSWASILQLIPKYKLRFSEFLLFLGYGSKSSGQFNWTRSFNWSQKRWFYEGHFLMIHGPAYFFQALFDRFHYFYCTTANSIVSYNDDIKFSWKKTLASLTQWGRSNRINKILQIEFIRSKVLSHRWFDEILYILPDSLKSKIEREEDKIKDLNLTTISRFDTKGEVSNPIYSKAIKLIDPKLLLAITEFLQVNAFKLFRDTDYWHCLVFGVQPGFKKDSQDWRDRWFKYLRLHWYQLQNIRFVYINWDWGTFMDRYIKIPWDKNGAESARELINMLLLLDKDNPKKQFYKDSQDHKDIVLSFLLTTVPAEDFSVIRLKHLRDLSRLVDIKAKLWYDFSRWHNIKLLTANETLKYTASKAEYLKKFSKA
jgi:hypothetical protein